MEVELFLDDRWVPLEGSILRGTLTPQVFRLHVSRSTLGPRPRGARTEIRLRLAGTEALAASVLPLMDPTWTEVLVVMPTRRQPTGGPPRDTR